MIRGKRYCTYDETTGFQESGGGSKVCIAPMALVTEVTSLMII